MKVPYIKATFQEAAYNLGNKIKTVTQTNKDNYVIDRLFAANNKIGDLYTGTKASKILNKVGYKASKDWESMHKIQNFLLKNSDKVSKYAVIGAAAAAAVAVTAALAKAFESTNSND